MQTTNHFMEYSIATYFCMQNINYLAFAGVLSYNIPHIFKHEIEEGYSIRAGLMTLMSVAILPIALFMPKDFEIGGKLLAWGILFTSGIFFATYGARVLQARLSLWLSKFTLKNSIRNGSKTDIRFMAKLFNKLITYNPKKYFDHYKGIFIGLDENQQPIYISIKEWVTRHFLVVGATRSGKGVIMQILGVQSLRLKETVVFFDPKGDQYMPHIFKAECDRLNLPYHYINLNKDIPQINLIADFEMDDLKNCFIEAFSQRERGAESDMYRKEEQEFIEDFSRFVVQQNNIKAPTKNLNQLCQSYAIDRFKDNGRSTISDLNKLRTIKSINSTTGKSIAELVDGGGCVYIVGNGLDETSKKVLKFIFCHVMQLAENYYEANNSRNITVFADELVSLISKAVALSYTVSLGWGLKIVSAIQDLKLLHGASADLNVEFLRGAIFGNSQNKLFYRCDDIETTDYLSDMTGQIVVEDEQKTVIRNSLNSEKLESTTRLTQSTRNYIDRNMILSFKEFEAVFCSSLPDRSVIASLCKTSPVPLPKKQTGKELTEINTNYGFYINYEANQLNPHTPLITGEEYENGQQSIDNRAANNDSKASQQATSTQEPNRLF